VEGEVGPGDLDPGDIITLPGSEEQMLVRAVRLGQGGFLLTVSPRDDPAPGAEREVTLTVAVRLARHGRIRAG
jgi:hypothetical protein